MSLFNPINISASALTAEKTRIDIITKNMANVNTTRATGGMPYRRQIAIFEENKSTSFEEQLSKYSNKISGKGVKISKIVEDESPFKLIYEPGHPDADENGYVQKPNVDTVKEMVDLISAQRSYDANITAMNASKSMLMKALDIGRR
ncbi:flagellar basal body rod protein FlgC [Tissierella pigra]|uniref:Flagellar basal-body rod protein FlgC n=1 Tax=Tissierella pigra TaxID=2607614 RepID=A0A6N7XW63_9FIRM|nr:flagellar basal body rod protein FlgC [Tissierella pigra]MBU5426524.1 flagellar basal body rod protein FlgC [Tissierella pigra]MSU00030.1 flagellar basal body rod protein FlgC [Tissierella pigra]